MINTIFLVAVIIIAVIGLTSTTIAYADHSQVTTGVPGRTTDNTPGILAQDNGGATNTFHPGCCVSFPPNGVTHGQAVKNNSPGILSQQDEQHATDFIPSHME